MAAILAIHPVAQTGAWFSVARGTLLFAVVLAAAALLVWLVTRLRGGDSDDTHSTHDSLTKFRDLHARGGLSDEEYRTIKTKLAAELDAGLGESASSDPIEE